MEESAHVSADLYSEQYYRSHLAGGDLAYERSQHWLRFFGSVADAIVSGLAPETVLDAGCAIGLLVEALRARGVDARGVDVSEYAIAQAPDHVQPYVRVGTLTEPVDGRFDLVTCIEVLEHLPVDQLAPALKNLTSVSDQLLISSSPEDFTEPTHLNVRPPEYWATKLAALGFYRDLDFDAGFLTPWAALFRRSEPPTTELVQNYEREHWRLLRERDALRAAAIDHMASDGSMPPAEDAQELRDQLRSAIDAAHGADARRATVEARLAHVEFALSAAEAREEEVAEMVEEIYDLCDGDIRRLQALLDARKFRAYWQLQKPYRWLRDRGR